MSASVFPGACWVSPDHKCEPLQPVLPSAWPLHPKTDGHIPTEGVKDWEDIRDSAGALQVIWPSGEFLLKDLLLNISLAFKTHTWQATLNPFLSYWLNKFLRPLWLNIFIMFLKCSVLPFVRTTLFKKFYFSWTRVVHGLPDHGQHMSCSHFHSITPGHQVICNNHRRAEFCSHTWIHHVSDYLG